MEQNRFKSKVAWGALLAFIFWVLKEYFNIQISNVDYLINTLLSVLVIFGILNDPTKKDGF